MKTHLKPKFKPQNTAYIIISWAKRLIMRVRIKSVRKVKINGRVHFEYEIWRYRSANEAGCYWGTDRVYEDCLFESRWEAWCRVTHGLSKDIVEKYVSTEIIDEDPHMTRRQIRKYNKENFKYWKDIR